MMKMFIGDDDELVRFVQQQTRDSFIKSILTGCKREMEKAEALTDQKSGINWNFEQKDYSVFVNLFEIIAADFRFNFNFRQFSLLDKKQSTKSHISSEWYNWFDNFLEKSLKSSCFVKAFLELSEAHRHAQGNDNDLRIVNNNPRVQELQAEIVEILKSMGLPDQIFTEFTDNNFSSENDENQVDWPCECTKIGKSPCHVLPCLTTSKKSASRGIMLE